jgi:hypothetical protein
MIWASLAAHFRKWKNQTTQVMNVAGREPNAAISPEWYAGLAVSPAAFSNQLSEMQISLLRAGQAHRGATVERVAVRSPRNT